MEKGRGVFKILTGNSTGKRLLGRPRRRWEDNIKEIDVNTRNWDDSAQDRSYWRSLVTTSYPILLSRAFIGFNTL